MHQDSVAEFISASLDYRHKKMSPMHIFAGFVTISRDIKKMTNNGLQNSAVSSKILLIEPV